MAVLTFIPSKDRSDAQDLVRLPGGGRARLVLRTTLWALVEGAEGGTRWIENELIGKTQRELAAEGAAMASQARAEFLAEARA